MYNAIDSCYKKAIKDYGVIATIGENLTKALIRETNDTYGIDYKKIISSCDIKQGNYVFIDGVQYLIIDTEEQLSQSIYNVGIFRETKEILLGSSYKSVQGIVDRDKVSIITSSGIQYAYDQYNFIIPKLGNKVVLNNEIVWDGGIYKVISVDTTKDGLYEITGKYNTVYNPHTYAISISENDKILVENETYTIILTCTDNNTLVDNPTITYLSSNSEIATVTENGVVSALKEGNTTITCTYNGVSAIFNLTVDAKSIEPVISYTYNLKQGTTIKQYVTNVITTFKTVDGVADPNLKINYVFDSVGQSLISSGQVVIAIINNSSISIKNAKVSAKTIIHFTVTDNANNNVIIDTDLTLITGI